MKLWLQCSTKDGQVHETQSDWSKVPNYEKHYSGMVEAARKQYGDQLVQVWLQDIDQGTVFAYLFNNF